MSAKRRSQATMNNSGRRSMHCETLAGEFDRVHRRDFFKAAAAGTGMVLAGGLVASNAPAAGPVKRNGKPHMKLSLAAYSFRDSLAGKDRTMTLDDFIRLCADLDLDGTELTSYYFPENFTED